MKKYRIALVGYGSAARNIHIPALRSISQAQIVGIFETRHGVECGFRRFSSLPDLLDAEPDIVVICTPPASHFEVAISALKAGAHVFCEKPLANSVEEAEQMAVVAARANREICVNSEFPFMPMHIAAAREIGSERFGRLLFVEARQSFVVTNETEKGWRGEDQQRTFKEFGTHVVDLCKFFFRERPIGLAARMPRPAAQGGPDYLNLVRLEFSEDRVAQITLDRLTKGQHRYLDMRLVGEKATIETSIGGSAEVSFGLRTQSRRPFSDFRFHLGGVARLHRGDQVVTLAKAPRNIFADATARLFRAFLEAIANGTEPPNGIDEARNTLDLVYRAYSDAEFRRG